MELLVHSVWPSSPNPDPTCIPDQNKSFSDTVIRSKICGIFRPGHLHIYQIKGNLLVTSLCVFSFESEKSVIYLSLLSVNTVCGSFNPNLKSSKKLKSHILRHGTFTQSCVYVMVYLWFKIFQINSYLDFYFLMSLSYINFAIIIWNEEK